MYACLGLLATNELPTVHDTLTALLDNQRADGLVPRRIGNGSNALGIIRSAIGLPPQAGSEMKSVDFAKQSIDANALVIWVAADYAAKARDTAFTAKYLPALRRAEAWLAGHLDGGLLKQDPYCDWKDMNARGGKVLYSNALYYKALLAMAALDPEQAAIYTTRAEALAGQIQAAFWDPTQGHFRDTLELTQFSPDGDLFACLVGLATPAQREAVFARCDALLTLRPLLPALDGDYPASMIPLQLKLAGLQDYHDRFEWPWLTSLYAWAAAAAGDQPRARRALDRVATYALRDGTFEEIYEGDEPRAVKRSLYSSETDFSWSAGLFLAASR
jgi:glycogen debranching enzyme